MIEKNKIKMICPTCDKQAISYYKFLFFIRRKIKCSKCKTRLIANETLNRMYWNFIIYIFIFLALTFFVVIIGPVGKGAIWGAIVYNLFLPIPGLFYVSKMWKKGGYKEENHNKELHRTAEPSCDLENKDKK